MDLFDKLKAEPPVNQKQLDGCENVDRFTTKACSSPRRESLPTPKSNFDSITTSKFRRSLSPDVIKRNCRETDKDVENTKCSNGNATDSAAATKVLSTPTKAQQKLFEPPVPQPNEFKVKRCKVRIKREDLVKLRAKVALENSQKQKKGRPRKNSDVAPKKPAGKRKATDADFDSPPPAKKGRLSTPKSAAKTDKKSKPATGFFIKLNSSPVSVKRTTPKKSTWKSQSPVGKNKSPQKARVNTASPTGSSTKATKFTRTQLIRSFGKRFFNSQVRIKRCLHPLMLTFEFNARARKLQAKEKSKNLSVSFKEQVEIFGGSDTESNDSEEINAAASGVTDAVTVTPARLKKVENGKVIDDIEFDPSLFIDASASNKSSTPLRRKPEKKSYSPLKDDGTSSARREQLKLANEKLPPCGLRRLRDDNVDDEDDDEDEYIVPIELPERRNSRHNSTSFSRDSPSRTSLTANDVDPSDAGATAVSKTANETASKSDSSGSFKSAINEESLAKESCSEEKKQKHNNKDSDEEVTRVEENVSTDNTAESTSGKQLQNDDKAENGAEDDLNKNGGENSKISDNATSGENETEAELENGGKNTEVDGDVSMKLFVETDSCNASSDPTFASGTQENFSDSRLKTTIEGISTDIEMTDMNNADIKQTSTVSAIAVDAVRT